MTTPEPQAPPPAPVPAPAPAPAAPAKPRMKRWKKVLFISGGVVLGLVLIVLAVGPTIIGSIAKSRIESTLGEQLQAAATVGNVSFSWSGHVQIDDFRLVPKNFTEPLVDVKKIDVHVSLGSAIGGSYIADVEVVAPKILVEKGPDGKFNYEFPPRPPKAPKKPKEKKKPGEKDEDERPFVQANFKVRDGEVKIRGRGRETVYPNVSVAAKVDTLEKPISYDVALDSALKIRGSIDLDTMSGPATLTFDRFSLKNTTGAARAYSDVAELDGTLSGSLDYRIQGAPRFAGRGKLEISGFALVMPGQNLKHDRIVFTHDGGIDEKGSGRHVISLIVDQALNATVTVDVVDAFNTRVARTDLKIDADLAGLQKGMAGTIQVRGATESKGPTQADLDAKKPRVAAKADLTLTGKNLDVKSMKLDAFTVRHVGTLDENGTGKNTVVLDSGKALQAKMQVDVTDAMGPAPGVVADVHATSDLGELGKLLEKMLGLKPDMIFEGAASLEGKIEAKGGDSARANLSLRTTNLEAIDAAKKRIEIEKALELKLVGGWDGKSKTATADVLKLTSSFATMDGKGGAAIGGEAPEIKETKVTIEADLEKLAGKLKSFMETPPALGGKAVMNAVASGEKVAVTVDLKSMKYGKYGPFDASLRQDGTLDRTGSGKHTIRLDSGKAVAATATADVKDAYKDTRATKIDVRLDSDLAALSTMLPGLIELKPGVALEGKASATAKAETKGSTWATFEAAANVDNLEAVEKGTRQEVDKSIRLQAAGWWDGAKKSVAIDAMTLTSAFATAEGKGGITLATPPAVSPTSTLKLHADLEKLGAKLGLFLAEPPMLAGTLSANVVPAGEKIHFEALAKAIRVVTKGRTLGLPDATIAGTATVQPKLEVAASAKAPKFEWIDQGYSAKGSFDAQIGYTEKGTTGATKVADLEVVDGKKNVLKDPGLTLVHDIGLSDENRTIDLRKVEISSGFLNGGMTGRILRRDPGLEFQKVRGTFKYIPEKLGAIAKPWLPGKLEGAEEKTLDLTLDGKAAATDALEVLRGTTGAIDLDLARFTMDGLSLSGKTQFKLQDGKLVSGTPLHVNKGRSDLSASIDFNPAEKSPQSTLTFNAKDVDANGQMGPILERINPIFHTSGIDAKVDGLIQSDFALVWKGAIHPDEKDWTAAASKALSGGGTFGAQNLSIAGSPAVGEIMKALGQGNALQGELIATQVKIENGKCTYQNMTLRGSRKEGAALKRDQEQLAADRKDLEEDRPGLRPKEYADRLEELKQREEDLPYRYTLRFSGWVKFDKTMQLRVLMPMTPNMIKSHPNLQKYIGTSFWVDLHGTTDKPSLDLNKMLSTAARRAAEGILAEKATDLIGGLLKNKKRESEVEKLFDEGVKAEKAGESARALDLYKKVQNDYRDTEFFRKRKTALEERISRLQGK